ncbi:major tail protein [Alkalicoccus luteus]|uniref:Phage tail protein n=1 Tax=Alkalicoccus luteus TaxID=1237094 RepID=A0A969TUL4_9BACI|nr:major tail protein [Alkalicoccus luteus]NJP37192.1 phage tail protein [Alkalicoccus luteus]
MALKGLKNLHYAPITSESESETVYGEVKPLGPAMALNIQPSINRANLRADDKVLFSDHVKGPSTVTLNTAYLDKAVEADILGKKTHENGLISDNVDDNPPYIAIGGQAESARGGYEFFWLYRVKLAPAEQNMNTKQETPEYSSPNLEGEAIARIHDGEEKVKVWDGDSDIDASVFENWFNEVIDKDYVAEA